MAFTEFATGDAQAVKRWSDTAFRETFGKMQVRSIIGRGNDSIIQLLTELDRDAGDQIKFDLLAQDRGDGVDGDSTLEGYEDELTYHQDSLYINQKRKGHAFKSMSQQRTVHDLRRDGRFSLTEWMAWFFEAGLFAHLCGTAGDGVESASGALGATTGSDWAGNSITTLDSDHLVDNGSSDFDLGMIDDALAKAAVHNPRVAPGMVDGRKMFVCYLHPYQTRSLWKDSQAVRSITDMLQNAGPRGSTNPIWTGALGMYRNVLLKESEFIPSIDNGANVDAIGVMLGAGAGAIGFGNAWDKMSRGTTDGSYFRVVEQKDDYDNRKGMAVSTIVGFKGCRFNSEAFGRIGLRSQETPPS